MSDNLQRGRVQGSNLSMVWWWCYPTWHALVSKSKQKTPWTSGGTQPFFYFHLHSSTRDGGKKEFGAIVPRKIAHEEKWMKETAFTQTGHADVSVAQELMQETKKKTQTHAPFPQNGVYEINKHAAIAENGRASGLSFSLFFFISCTNA